MYSFLECIFVQPFAEKNNQVAVVATFQSQASRARKHTLPYGLFDCKWTLIYQMNIIMYKIESIKVIFTNVY